MNDTFYNQPHLLLDQVIDNDEIVMDEEEWSQSELSLYGFEGEIEQEAKKLHNEKQKTIIKKQRKLLNTL